LNWLTGISQGLKADSFLVFDELAHHEVFAEDFLIAKTDGVDFAELRR